MYCTYYSLTIKSDFSSNLGKIDYFLVAEKYSLSNYSYSFNLLSWFQEGLPLVAEPGLHEDMSCTVRVTLYPILLVISSLGLLLTIAIYTAIPSLRYTPPCTLFSVCHIVSYPPGHIITRPPSNYSYIYSYTISQVYSALYTVQCVSYCILSSWSYHH